MGEERVDVGHGLRILVAADDPLVRAGLSALVSAHAGFDVIGEIGLQGSDAAIPLSAAPDVILVDIGSAAAAVAEQLAALESFGVPVMAVVANPARGRVALAAGARGYVHRAAGGERLATALAAVAAGWQVTEPPAHGHDEAAEPVLDLPVEELTPRELEVLQLIAEGLPNKGIASRLHISEHTVKFHVTALMGKLDAHSRTEAVTRAARMGLLLF